MQEGAAAISITIWYRRRLADPGTGASTSHRTSATSRLITKASIVMARRTDSRMSETTSMKKMKKIEARAACGDGGKCVGMVNECSHWLERQCA